MMMKSIVIISKITVIEMLKHITQQNPNFKLDEINAKICFPQFVYFLRKLLEISSLKAKELAT